MFVFMVLITIFGLECDHHRGLKAKATDIYGTYRHLQGNADSCSELQFEVVY